MSDAILDPERGYLNKWEMYKALKNHDIGACLLPETAVFGYDSMKNLFNKSYSSLYIKPVDTWGGKGISRVEFDTETNRWSWIIQGGTLKTYPSLNDLYQTLHTLYNGQFCIIQQSAPLLTWDGRPFDIRLHMQRDIDNLWKPSGRVVRVSGEASSIVSNVTISGGFVTSLEKTLDKTLHYKQRKSQRFTKKLHDVGDRICHILEEYREFYEIGMDFGVDRDGHLWLIEVNTDDAICGPSHELFVQLGDKEMLRIIQERYHNRQLKKTKMLFDLIFSNQEP